MFNFQFCSFFVFIIMVGVTSCKFPNNFKFGVATSAYQIEGGWNASGKTESIWDYQTHTFPEKIKDGSNGDIACDSYHKIDEDVNNLKTLKVNFYRFSLSWPRLLPTGFPNVINDDGVRYYNELIDKLLENDIEPVVTLFHWDLPQSLQDLGGWSNIRMADYFADYARICFNLFGDRVKTWITINEPYQICQFAYGEAYLAPFHTSDGIGNYLCGHTILLAHAKVYRIYKNEFYNKQYGKVGISIETSWWQPATNSKEDKEAAEIRMQFYYGWFAHPICSKNGDYPKIFRQLIDMKSKAQGFTKSRLPYFTKEEINMIRGSYDFLGLNHYTTFLCRPKKDFFKVPSFQNDSGVEIFMDDKWPTTARTEFRFVPWGLRNVLNWIKNNYGNPDVIITENGYAGYENETTEDIERVRYYNAYLKEVLKAIHEDYCNVIAYTAWSFMDNYEWSDGYTLRFGMYYVDFNDPERKRVPKKSAFVYQNIIVTRDIQENVFPDHFLH